MTERIGLFGGSFNPIHVGHLIIARVILEKLKLTPIVFLPSRRPPHKADLELLAPDHRAEMVRLAIAGEPGFDFSDFDLTRDGPCYTIDTVQHFRDRLGPDAELFWIIGGDSLSELPTWHRASELVEACQIVTAARSTASPIDGRLLESRFGLPQARKLKEGVLDTPRIDISSTDIRRRLQLGLSIRHLVPDAVYNYIEENRIYRPM